MSPSSSLPRQDFEINFPPGASRAISTLKMSQMMKMSQMVYFLKQKVFLRKQYQFVYNF